MPPRRSSARWPALIAGMLLAAAGHAQVIDADVTGTWYPSEQSGHGLQIEMLDLGRAVMTWYTFDPEGRPLWLLGTVEARGDRLEGELLRYHGGRFPPDFDPDEIVSEAWGQIEFRLTGCNRAELDYQPLDPEFAAGTLDLERLTRIDGLTCRGNEPAGQRIAWNLTRGAGQFEPLFLDLPDDYSPGLYQLEAAPAELPEPWSRRGGIRISGTNRSDDLMMVLMRPLDGLQPDSDYRVELAMQFATREAGGCPGIGGSPGDSVFMRLGAAGEKPDYEVVEEASRAWRRASLDLGQQANAGADALPAGTMANGLGEEWCGDPDRPWRLKRVDTGDQALAVTADEHGRIWVYGLSDSGFEGTTTWYLTEFVVRLSEAD